MAKTHLALGEIEDFSGKGGLDEAWNLLRKDIEEEDFSYSKITDARDDFLLQSMAPALLQMSRDMQFGGVSVQSFDNGLTVQTHADGRDLIFCHKNSTAAIIVSLEMSGSASVQDPQTPLSFLHLSAATLPDELHPKTDMSPAREMIFSPPLLSDLLEETSMSSYKGNICTKTIPLNPNMPPAVSTRETFGNSERALRLVSDAIDCMGYAHIVEARADKIAKMNWEHYEDGADLPLIRFGMGLGWMEDGLMTNKLFMICKDMQADCLAVKARPWVGSLWETIPMVGELGHDVSAGSDGLGDGCPWTVKSAVDDQSRTLIVTSHGRVSTLIMTGPPQDIGSSVAIFDGEGTVGAPLAFLKVEEEGLRGYSYTTDLPTIRSGIDTANDFNSVQMVNDLIEMLPEFIYSTEERYDEMNDGMAP